MSGREGLDAIERDMKEGYLLHHTPWFELVAVGKTADKGPFTVPIDP